VLGNVDAAVLDAAVERAWGGCAPATWNRHVATTRSFVAFCRRRGWLPGDLATLAERRREPADRTRAIPYVQIERLWRREDVAVREKALWRLLYETAARASEVLSLNVEDVDLENRRAIVCSKGGDLELLHFQTASARLLPRLIAGRASGPLFLTDRRPAPGRMAAIVDVCPVTGRARLSYRRAEEIFCETSGGWTLHQLRHSAITHLAEADVGLALLMAKSRHTNLRSLQRYARPGADAVAALTAAHDPDRRRR
jgi:integrase